MVGCGCNCTGTGYVNYREFTDESGAGRGSLSAKTFSADGFRKKEIHRLRRLMREGIPERISRS